MQTRYFVDAAPVEFEVIPFQDLRGRWHRLIHRRMPGQICPSGLDRRCHEEQLGVECIGFKDWDAATENGWEEVRKILGGCTTQEV